MVPDNSRRAKTATCSSVRRCSATPNLVGIVVVIFWFRQLPSSGLVVTVRCFGLCFFLVAANSSMARGGEHCCGDRAKVFQYARRALQIEQELQRCRGTLYHKHARQRVLGRSSAGHTSIPHEPMPQVSHLFCSCHNPRWHHTQIFPPG
jgi:hypothetical protein